VIYLIDSLEEVKLNAEITLEKWFDVYKDKVLITGQSLLKDGVPDDLVKNIVEYALIEGLQKAVRVIG